MVQDQVHAVRQTMLMPMLLPAPIPVAPPLLPVGCLMKRPVAELVPVRELAQQRC